MSLQRYSCTPNIDLEASKRVLAIGNLWRLKGGRSYNEQIDYIAQSPLEVQQQTLSFGTCVIYSERLQFFSYAKVGDLQCVFEGHEEVSGLDVIVDYALTVQVLQSVDKLNKVLVGLVERKSRSQRRCKHLLQHTHAILHHQIHLLLLLVVQHIDQLHNVPVPERSKEEDLVADVELAVGYPPKLPFRENLRRQSKQTSDGQMIFFSFVSIFSLARLTFTALRHSVSVSKTSFTLP